MSRFPRPGRTPRPRPVPTAGPTPTPSPTPGPGTTFTLTTNIETVPASGVLPANSTVTGVIAGSGGSAAGSTYQTGDIINANQTSDVKVTVANGGVPAQVVAINNAGSVQFRNVAGASQDVNAVLFSGVTQVGSFGSLGNSDLAITNGDIASRYALINPTAQATGSVADLTVGFINATGTADVAKFSVENVGFAATASGVTTVTNAALTVTGNTAESASIATTGTNFFRPTIGSAATSLAITGSGNNSVTLASGDLTNNAKTVTFAAASGANALELGSFVRAGDTYTGGSGVDVLGITPAGLGATALNVSGFETLALQSGAAAGILGFAAAPNFQRVNVLPSASNATITLSNAGTIPALNFVGASATAAQNFNSVSAPTSGTVNASFAGGSSYEIGDSGAITLNGASTINVAIAGTSATQSNLTSDTVASNALVSFSASGTGALSSTTSTVFTVNGSGGTAQNLQTINLSGLTGTAVSQIQTTTNSFTALSVTASPGGTTYTPGVEGNTDVVTFTGGLGADTLTATTYLGLSNFNGGAGTDTVNGNNSTNSPGIIFAQGGAGNDTLTGGSAADTLQGDADNDLISGRIGLDVVSGGTGQDTFRYQESLTTDVDTITDFAFGSTGDNIGYTVGSAAFVFGNSTFTTLNNVQGATLGTSSASILATFGGGAVTAAVNTSSNFLQLTATNATSFAGAIGGAGVNINGTTAFAATDSLAASYFDSTNQQAVFGFITNTNLDGVLNSSDTFTEVARASTTLTGYQSLAAGNVTFF